jgi:hypothetical protein
MAAEGAGGKEGLVGYLQDQAIKNPGPFMSLLGKVLPTQIAGDPDNPAAPGHHVIITFVGAPTEFVRRTTGPIAPRPAPMASLSSCRGTAARWSRAGATDPSSRA